METTTNATSLTESMVTISIVTYNPDLDEFSATLSTLADALSHFDPSSVTITIVDNSNDDMITPIIEAQLASWKTNLINGHNNIGFGRGHNLVLGQTGEFHLILNPDTQLDRHALQKAISFMKENPICGLLSPHAIWPDGQRQYLCKQYPAIFDLFLRGFAPNFLKVLFRKRLERYEMRTETQEKSLLESTYYKWLFLCFSAVKYLMRLMDLINDTFFISRILIYQ
ncbi:glycosyltransferase family 2 protein [Brucella sp. JSBI001]|uniref:glycosyltransferase family 2 protein n=1 Tax=Brucella sp. JSBI001 TaxID=2886044 RepID=UPI0022317AA3|nr:glycosyltransferase family 2 protein [Brucella sp. JSBI001]UZD70431.1 glycosyltransferase family 2 protein [Brucella sp. JSBI001]